MSLAYRISAFNRLRKWQRFLGEVRPTPRTTVLDVGFQEEEYSATDNYIEKHYPYPEKLTALGVETPDKFRERYPSVTVIRYDGGRFPFEDGAFDVCWSNAVLEHVGDREKQRRFIREIRRVSRVAFITTPNRFFPVETHTRVPLLHFLPKPVFDAILRKTKKKWAAGDYMHLLSERELRALLDECSITRYRVIRNRLLGWTLDFIVILS